MGEPSARSGYHGLAHLLPRLRMHDDTLCALREGVSPGMAKEECAIMHRWLEG